MDDMHKSIPEYSQEDLDQVFSNAYKAFTELHQKLSVMTEETGYITNILPVEKEKLDYLLTFAESNPRVYPIIASAINQVNLISSQIVSLGNNIDSVYTTITSVSNTSASLISSTDAVAAIYDAPTFEFTPQLSTPPERKLREFYSNQLRLLNPSLGDSYDEVWQTYFGTKAEPHRSALFMMRTVFDNFFAFLAPDDEVRESQYWAPKEGEKKNEIHRSERIEFAINESIEDVNIRNLLEEQANQISILYKGANYAHKRGTLDEEKASKTILAMDNFLHDWIDSLKFSFEK